MSLSEVITRFNLEPRIGGPNVSLSETIAGLEPDESVKFSQGLFALRYVVKKGDEQQVHKEITGWVDSKLAAQGSLCCPLDEVLAIELRQALSTLRRSEAIDGQ
jgi:hypothetical protein